jgi:hypothetical protein
MQGQDPNNERCCPVFGVRSCGPIIGLGILIILFGLIPPLFLQNTLLPVPIVILFIGFGIFLIGAGVAQ